MRMMEAGAGAEAGRVDRAHLIADFLYLQRNLNRRPTVGDFLKHCHTPKVLERVFGKPGWRRLVRAVGRAAMPKPYRGSLTREHLIEDYLNTEKAVGRKPGYYHFHALHRHGVKAMTRVFGRPGWTKLRKAAGKAKREQAALLKKAPGQGAAVRLIVRASADGMTCPGNDPKAV